MSPTLDALSFPLHGSRLIEASAGTGKTFTIAALYLRLVLGHGGPAAFQRPLTPPQILVVTFTDAATKELRDRIRSRLAEAAEAFGADPAGLPAREPGQDLLHDLRASYPAGQWPACARHLRLAAEWMDEAAVSTIHGWCHRMLREHAFDSGSLFTQRLETDQRELQAEAARDYWRTFFTPLPVDQAAVVRAWWPTPDALLAAATRLLPHVTAEAPPATGSAPPSTEALAPGLPPDQALSQAAQQAAQALAALKAPWGGERGWAVALLAGLDAAVAAKQCKMPKRKDWMQALRAWAEGDDATPALTKTAWERLPPEALAREWTGDPALLQHPACQALATLRQQLASLPTGREQLLSHAAHWLARRLATEQARRAQMGFNELLTRLDAALQGPNGPRLAAVIRSQFPVALIDEFQDTDPLQYRIFDTLYRVAAHAPETALVLIGDPKQAIYAFRGADIFTYLAAKRATAGRHATLATNHRSSAAMVEAVNRVFLRAEDDPASAGAFLFRGEADNPLPFEPAKARGRAETWQVEGAPAPALTCWCLPGDATVTATDAQPRMAAACASEIVRLLQLGQAGQAGFARPGAPLVPLQPGDLAVLVNSGREAAAVRQALQARGVRSVYLSDKEGVFQSPAAAELQRWLTACAEPDQDRPLRAALGSALLDLPWAELDRLGHDELHWEERVLQFRQLQQVWRRQGVLPMLRRLLHAFGVPQRLLAGGQERLLTDLLHLAELLQEASTQLQGEHALIRWLAEQRQEAEEAAGAHAQDTRKLRLESDADLVKVVTVHKSKGLEYPLVFLPFATAHRVAKPQDLPLSWHDDDGRLQVALQASDEALARVDRERLGEDLRKLYVALTRARHATWLGAAPLPGVERSALGYLLGAGQPLDPAGLRQALQALAGPPSAPGMAEVVAVAPAPEPGDSRFHSTQATPTWQPEPPLPAGPREPWWIASYSALHLADTTPDGLLEDEASAWPAAAPAGLPAPAFPAGPASAAEDTYAETSQEPVDEMPEHLLAGAFDSLLAEAEGTAETAALGRAVSEAESAAGAAADLHGFPRGAGPGSFLHGLLEWVGQQGFARVAHEPALQADLADLIARRCNLGGWSAWTGPLRDWLLAWLHTPLRLQALGQDVPPVAPSGFGAVQVEMEFWLAAHRVPVQALDALVTRHTLGGAPRPALQPQQLNGMLKGFIDLVFEHQGRYFVADYKSNWLGPRDASYTPAALQQAVLQHRYELQYVLYCFALHRLLRVRLPDYDYDRHLGGAVYLFLRGHAAPSQGLHCERPPRALIEALDRMFAGEAP